MKVKKSILALVSATVLLAGLVGCSSEEANVTQNESTAQSNIDTKEETTEKVEGQIGDFIVKIKSSEKFTDWEGNSALKVVLDFTNNSKEAQSFDIATMAKAFQDGVEIEQVFDVENLGENASKEIKPGTTLEVSIGFKLSNEKSPVEVEIEELFALNDDKVVETINLQ